MLDDLYQDLIIEHGRKPKNFGPLPCATHEAEGFNPLCGDQVTVRLIVDNGIVQRVMFEGAGCAISQASASLMTETIKGKSVAEALTLVQLVRRMMVEGQGSDELGVVQALAPIREYPMRVKCATLAWHALAEALHKEVA